MHVSAQVLLGTAETPQPPPGEAGGNRLAEIPTNQTGWCSKRRRNEKQAVRFHLHTNTNMCDEASDDGLKAAVCQRASVAL